MRHHLKAIRDYHAGALGYRAALGTIRRVIGCSHGEADSILHAGEAQRAPAYRWGGC